MADDDASSCSAGIWPICVALGIALYCVHHLRRMHAASSSSSSSSSRKEGEHELTLPLLGSARRKSPRFVALDAFRGTTICLMIYVNYGGAGFAIFEHSAWDGFTVADTVFPWFAWIMGFSVFLVTRRRRDQAPREYATNVLARALRLFVLGLVLNNGATWKTWRIPGVLQGLAFAYAYVALAGFAVGSTERDFPKSFVKHILLGLLPPLVLNLAITFGLPVPGCPTGYLGPGGDIDGGIYRGCTGGAHLYVDRAIFSNAHIYQHPTCQPVWHTGAFDPEGALNWLMMAVTAYLGFLFAWLHAELASPRRALGFGGLALVASGLVLNFVLPINKNLWSLSFVLLAAGLAALVLVLHDFCITWHKLAWSGFPLAAVGHNAIFLYVMHEIMYPYTPFSARRVDDRQFCQPHLVYFLHHVAALLCWMAVAVWLHRRHVFISM